MYGTLAEAYTQAHCQTHVQPTLGTHPMWSNMAEKIARNGWAMQGQQAHNQEASKPTAKATFLQNLFSPFACALKLPHFKLGPLVLGLR